MPDGGGNQFEHRLAEFQAKIADKTIGDNHIRAIVEQHIFGFDVADEVQPTMIRQLNVGVLHQFITLVWLLAIRQQADSWRGNIQHVASVDAAHLGELHQIFGLAIGRRARINQQHRAA